MRFKQTVKHFYRLNLFLFLALSTLFIACGKRKPPLPPIEKVSQKVEISGFQRGNQIRLSWTMPNRNAPDGSLLKISRADIYRLAEPINSPESLTEQDFANRSTLIATMPVTDADFARKTLNYYDTLQFAGQNIRLRYAVRFVNDSGSKAAFSNFLLIEPIAKIANFPSLSPVRYTQDEILLNWQSPETNIDGSKPANIIGFNIYRASAKEETAKLINQTPITNNEFTDKNFEFEMNYRYFVRTVSLGANAEPVESQESNIIEILPKDTFPPNSPNSLTIAATPNSISIFFVPNSERDLAGYKVFRSTDKENWQLQTEKLLQTTTFQDTKIESGKTYYYYLIAVDKFGNESEKSEIVSEMVP
jgi:predicted phage tail protein